MLHSFYRMPVSLTVGGRLFRTWVRWYRAPEGAKKLPFPSFIYSRVWSQPHQDDGPEMGERGYPRIWTRGQNPGFQGQQYIGRPEWFMTGQLPDYVLTDPLPDVPAWCCTPPARGIGPLILSGSAVASGGMPARAGGTAVIGGSAIAAGYPPARGSGPLVLGGGASGAGYPPARGSGPVVLGGGASGAGYPPARGSGPLVLGGGASGAGYPPARGAGPLVLSGAAIATMASGPPPSAYGSPSGGTAETNGCDRCPNGAAVQYTFDVEGVTNAVCTDCALQNGTHVVTYSGGCTWDGPEATACGAPFRGWKLTISPSGVISLDTAVGVTYQRTQDDWDCLSPLLIPRQAVVSANCTTWPLSLTIYPV